MLGRAVCGSGRPGAQHGRADGRRRRCPRRGTDLVPPDGALRAAVAGVVPGAMAQAAPTSMLRARVEGSPVSGCHRDVGRLPHRRAAPGLREQLGAEVAGFQHQRFEVVDREAVAAVGDGSGQPAPPAVQPRPTSPRCWRRLLQEARLIGPVEPVKAGRAGCAGLLRLAVVQGDVCSRFAQHAEYYRRADRVSPSGWNWRGRTQSQSCATHAVEHAGSTWSTAMPNWQARRPTGLPVRDVGIAPMSAYQGLSRLPRPTATRVNLVTQDRRFQRWMVANCRVRRRTHQRVQLRKAGR